jgi:putative membrane protein
MVTDIRTAVSNLKPLLSSTGKILDDIYPVLGAADDTVVGLDDSLTQLQSVLVKLEEKLGDIIGEVRQTDKSEQKEKLIELLGGDSSSYSDYFSSMVGIRTEKVYSLGFYGEAMTPFYTVIALWVGGVMLVTIMQTNINRRRFPDATESQGFFGRLIIFVLIGQLQAAVVTAGNIFLMHCEPVHPWLMWLSAAVASFVFIMLIYALTLAFGDVGKAIVVVVMVLQIAGSSGSYPIEILPPVFSKIFRFFPFPYAINAMREAICGTYGHDFIKYLAELMLFAVLALAIGLLIRRPFMGMNRFVSEKLEETEVL